MDLLGEKLQLSVVVLRFHGPLPQLAEAGCRVLSGE
jgi:hypothetical protein